MTLGLWVDVEGRSFEKRLPLFLPLLCNCLSLYDPQATECLEEGAGKGGGATETEEDGNKHGDDLENDGDVDGIEHEAIENGESDMDIEQPAAEVQSESEEPSSAHSEHSGIRIMDQLLFSSLSTLRKICSECPVLGSPTHCETMNVIWGKYIHIQCTTSLSMSVVETVVIA